MQAVRMFVTNAACTSGCAVQKACAVDYQHAVAFSAVVYSIL